MTGGNWAASLTAKLMGYALARLPRWEERPGATLSWLLFIPVAWMICHPGICEGCAQGR